MIYVSHYVGLSGVGGVQRNFKEYYQNAIEMDPDLIHTIYTNGLVDEQYNLSATVYDVSKFINMLRFLLDICSNKKIVHIYNRLTSPGFAKLLSILPAKKIIVHERGSAWNCSSTKSKPISMVAEKASLILANSNATKQLLIKKFSLPKQKIEVIHNGIDPSMRVIADNMMDEISSIFTVGFLGRLDTPKGIHVLIDAVHNLSCSNIELLIAGDGVLKDELIKRADDTKNIRFIGRVSNPYKFLKTVDLLIVPSIREPFGNVCLEAGLCGVPVIAANIDGIPEIIEDDYSGILIKPDQIVDVGNLPESAVPIPEQVYDPMSETLVSPKQLDPNKLSEKICLLSQSPSERKRLARNLKDTVLERFTVGQYIKKLHEVYRRFE